VPDVHHHCANLLWDPSAKVFGIRLGGTFSDLQAGERIVQKNEGKWAFTLREVGSAVVLDVDLGRGVLTSEIRGEVHPGLVRMLVKVIL